MQQSSNVSFAKRFAYFYNAPVIVFWYNVLLFICFLGIFSYELLIVFIEQSFDWAEVILCVWVFSFLVEEVYMVCAACVRRVQH